MKSLHPFFYAVALMLALSFTQTTEAQSQYKLKQVNTVSGMKMESTIYVKPKRKRTESPGMMGMGARTTIEQCDLQRTITLNDKRKLYHIEPFSKNAEEIIDEDAKQPAATKPKPVTNSTKKGGTITMYHSIVDTGERKQMYGFTARHMWTTMKMKPSADACTMKDSMVMKTDGWYIDLPEFNCPVRYSGYGDGGGQQYKPDCMDHFVTRRSGKGKPGFPLIEKRTMIMGGQVQEFTMELNTLELTTGKLDSMLFEIPPGYTEVKDISELNDKMDAASMKEQIENYKKNNNIVSTPGQPTAAGNKREGVIRVGVFEPTGEATLPNPSLQAHLAGVLNNGNIEAVPVSSEDQAKSMNCDYVLNTTFTRVKAASKVGGLIKAIKNTDPTAAGAFNIDATMNLKKLADGSVKTEKVSGKYDGGPEGAAKRALEEGGASVLRDLK